MWFKTPPSPKSYLVLCEKVCNQITRMLCWKKNPLAQMGKSQMMKKDRMEAVRVREEQRLTPKTTSCTNSLDRYVHIYPSHCERFV